MSRQTLRAGCGMSTSTYLLWAVLKPRTLAEGASVVTNLTLNSSAVIAAVGAVNMVQYCNCTLRCNSAVEVQTTAYTATMHDHTSCLMQCVCLQHVLETQHRSFCILHYGNYNPTSKCGQL